MKDQSVSRDNRWATFAVILIAIGAIFLLGELLNFRLGAGFWPFFLIIPGVALLVTAFGRGEANAGPAVPGAVLTTLGTIFLYQNAAAHWESWAYVWALIPLSVGIALIAVGSRNDDQAMVRSGRQTARTFAIVFAAGLIFFELLIFDRGGLGGYLLPIALIVVGGVILWLHFRRGGTLPWIETMGRSREPVPPETDPGESPAPMAGSSVGAATPPAPAPTIAATTPPSPPSSHFPEDELPHTPEPDDARFPQDENSPPTEPAAEVPLAKPRRRSPSGTRKKATPKPSSARRSSPS